MTETAPIRGGVDYIDPLLHRNINLGTRDEYLMDHDYDLHRRGKLSKKEHKRLYGKHRGVDRGYDTWNYGHLVDFSPVYGSRGYMPGMGYGVTPGMGYGMGTTMLPGVGMGGLGYGYDRGLGLGRGISGGYDETYHRPGLIGRGMDTLGLGHLHHHHPGMGYGVTPGMGYGVTPGMGYGMGTTMLPGVGMGGLGYGYDRGISDIGMGPGMGMGMGPGMGMGMGPGMGGMIDESRFLKLPHYERINENPNIDNTTLWRPRADIFDVDQEHLRVEFELPGVPREDISLTIQDNILTLAALKPQTRKEEVGFHYQNERHFGKFYRRMMLPFSVDPNKVKAHMDNGVLKVHLVRVGGVAGRIPIGEGLLGQQGSTMGSTMGTTPIGSTTTPMTSGTSTGSIATTRI